MRIYFDLNDDARKALIDNKDWNGYLKCKIIKDKEKQTNLFESKAITKTTYNKEDICKDISSLIEMWNSLAISYKVDDGRNNEIEFPIPEKDMKIIENVVASLGIDIIQEKLNVYKIAIDNDDHVRSGRNMAYGNFISFMKAIKKQGKRWFEGNLVPEIEDEYPKYTYYVANAYASQFLGRQEYNLVNPSVEYKKFKKCGLLCKKVSEKMGCKFYQVVERLFKCLLKHYEMNDIIPGHLCSSRTWKLLFPKYLKNLYGENKE